MDSERSLYRLPRHEQRLERRKEATSYCTGKARMVLTTHRGSHRCAQGDGERISKNSRSYGVPAWVGTPSAGKTGHTADPRPGFKTGHTGDPRLFCGFFTKTIYPELL